jgi:hypothetical protein
MENYKVGQLVSYKNGNPTVQTGTIVKVLPNQLIIIDDKAGMILYNAGHSVGDCISPSQIINPIN